VESVEGVDGFAACAFVAGSGRDGIVLPGGATLPMLTDI
jgi:hypothetical protein